MPTHCVYPSLHRHTTLPTSTERPRSSQSVRLALALVIVRRMPPAYSLLDGDGRLKNAATAARARLPLLAGGCGFALLLLGLLSLSGRGGQPVLSAGQGTLDTAYPARPLAAATSHSAAPFALADLFDKGFIASLDDQLQRWAASREGVVDTVRRLNVGGARLISLSEAWPASVSTHLPGRRRGAARRAPADVRRAEPELAL